MLFGSSHEGLQIFVFGDQMEVMMTRGKSNRSFVLIITSVLLLMAIPVLAAAQGRGRGLGRGRNQNWKCGVFVNCHDARNGRWDGRGPNRSVGIWRNGVARGANVRYRNRYSTNDYWRRRHLMYRTRNFDNGNLRYRNRVWRNR